MLKKCKTVRIFLYLVACATISREVSAKSFENGSDSAPTGVYDGLATPNYETERPTTSSREGILIGDGASINYAGMLVQDHYTTYLPSSVEKKNVSSENGVFESTDNNEITTVSERGKATTYKYPIENAEKKDHFYWLDSNQYETLYETEDNDDSIPPEENSEQTTAATDSYENNDDLSTTITNPDSPTTSRKEVESATEVIASTQTYTGDSPKNVDDNTLEWKEKLLIQDEDNKGGNMSKTMFMEIPKESNDVNYLESATEDLTTNIKDTFTEETIPESTVNNAEIEESSLETNATYTQSTTSSSSNENIVDAEEMNEENVSSTTKTDFSGFATEKMVDDQVYSTLYSKNKDDTISVDVTTSYTETTVYSTNNSPLYEGNSLQEDIVASTEQYEKAEITTNNIMKTTSEVGNEESYSTTLTETDTSSSLDTTIEYSGVTDGQESFVTEESKSSEDMKTTMQRKTSLFETTTTSVPNTVTNKEIIEESTNYFLSTEAEELSTTSTQAKTSLSTFSTTHTSEKTINDGERDKTKYITTTFQTDIPVTSERVTEAVITTTSGRTSTCKDATIVEYHIDVGKTELQVKWRLHYEVLDNSCRLKINVSCISTDSLDLTWVVRQRRNSTDVEDEEPVSFLGNLSEFTNYTCIGLLFVDAEDGHQVLISETFNVTTQPEVPSDIKFSIRNVTARNFSLIWKKPDKIPGNLLNYHILIKTKKSHHIRDDCSNSSKISEITITFFSDRKYLFHNFEMAQPNHLYEVKILAQDEAGNSTGISQEVLTKSSPSTAPLNVKSTLQSYTFHCNHDVYNTTLHLTWEWPCNTNGNLEEFQINISEVVVHDTKREYTGNRNIYKVPRFSEYDTFELIVENLNASCVYEATIVAVTGDGLHGVPAKHTTDRTKDGCPLKPSEITVIPTGSNFILEWKEPEKFHGKILDYTVFIIKEGPKHNLSKDPSCEKHPLETINQSTNSTSYKFDKGFPNFAYTYLIVARTSAGLGDSSDNKKFVTPSEASEPIRDLEMTKLNETISYGRYECWIRLNFKEPCNTNGIFRYYMIEEKGRRLGYPDFFRRTNITATSYEVVLEKPEYHYEFALTVVTEKNMSPFVSKKMTTSASIPMVNRKKISCITDQDMPTLIKLELEEGMFDNDNGVIVNYGIYLYEGVVEDSITQEPRYGIWDLKAPDVNKTTYPFIGAAHIYQISAKSWNPFTEKINKISIHIGKKENCSQIDFCKSLAEDTSYLILLRGFTKTTYRDVFISIKTGIKPSSANFFLIFLVVLVVILVIGVYIYSKRPNIFIIRFRSIPNASIEEAIPRHLVLVKHFIAYYNKIQNDPTLLRKQYEEIEDEIKRYKEENVHTTFALKPENKRKNRYTNILPYDEYRVKLNIDEDDEICTDYINASYIRGVSGEIEYIATQGPLEHTCKDFWKMVIQENITVIVMVSQFVEKEKEKCFKYFPNNHENMMICEDLEVKCLTELQFDTYCVRTLMIRKDVKQYSVIHMQYLDWPDFGCPTGTFNMLSFCEEVRERIQIEKGLMAVHCSAGVGRTGTLISLDILLQTMRRKKEISVFECVLDLRKQRTHMVQTEKQYVYIHTCLKDVLENSSLYTFDETKKNEEHIYQNIKKENVRVVKNKNCEEKESAF